MRKHVTLHLDEDLYREMKIQAVREAYRILFMQRKLLPIAMEQIERELGHVDVVTELLAFIRASKRGVISSCGYGNAA